MTKAHELLVTAEGLQKMKDELEYLKGTRRKEIAVRLKDAIAYGDLSENSEYQESKEEQAFLEGKIIELDVKIKSAKIVEEDTSTTSVHVGSVIELTIDGEKSGTFTLVGATEADPFTNKISNESPAGIALWGAKKGESVMVKQGENTLEYMVTKIS